MHSLNSGHMAQWSTFPGTLSTMLEKTKNIYSAEARMLEKACSCHGDNTRVEYKCEIRTVRRL